MHEHHGQTPSERMVTRLCQQSFLKLWTHPNPKGKHGKELCDCLIVCGPHIVIISVKDSKYRATDDETGWKRWAKTSIEKSAAQISGAERWLRSVDKIERHDGRVIWLPDRTNRKYHRVSVALGGRGQVPLQWGDFGGGFLLSGGMFDMHSKEISNNEMALVTMALEPRRNRLVISEAFLEFLQKQELNSAARAVQGRGGNAFVFTVGSSDDREFRARELALRCLVVRGRLPNTHTVVGIATDRPGVSSSGYSSDIVYIHMPEWTREDEQCVLGISD